HYATDAEYSMARRTMAYLLFNPTWPTEWSLQNAILAWNDYMYTGDDAFLEKYYEELKLKTLMPLEEKNGLISTRTGKQTPEFLKGIRKLSFDGKADLRDIVDWPQNGVKDDEKEYRGETDGFVFNTYNAVVNAFYYNTLRLMEKIARVVDQPADAVIYRKKADRVYEAYQQVFRDPSDGLIKDGDSTTHKSLHSNMFALDFGLIREADLPNVIRHIRSRRMACSVYGSQFLLDGLYDVNEDRYPLELMTATNKRSWYNMIRIGSTITLEAWDKLYKPNLDLNHAWGAAPANIIVRRLMGIEPLSPGFGQVSVKPRIGSLSSAAVETSTLKGKLSVSFNTTDSTQTWNLIIPGSCLASVYLPANRYNKQLYVDGKLVSGKQKNGYWIIPPLRAGSHELIIR
ncbi:MAG TPA: alpha-L-rhamnosidase C-terminal domain-containing protein, partial [Bacillota bacterium]|nr:alpha-L-rhamnosidase C-terminal domain-containing protein [Bacillota bacterium]